MKIMLLTMDVELKIIHNFIEIFFGLNKLMFLANTDYRCSKNKLSAAINAKLLLHYMKIMLLTILYLLKYYIMKKNVVLERRTAE